MAKQLKERKLLRLQDFDYSSCGAYFITICTNDRKCVFSHIVGTGVLDGPSVQLLPHGIIADKYIKQLNDFYNHISIEKFIIMPNHLHMLVFIQPDKNGPSGTPVPTIQNSTISKFVSTFKRFCNKEYGENIWQRGFYDHVIRNRQDYEEHIKYILENPMNWYYDELYTEK